MVFKCFMSRNYCSIEWRCQHQSDVKILAFLPGFNTFSETFLGYSTVKIVRTVFDLAVLGKLTDIVFFTVTVFLFDQGGSLVVDGLGVADEVERRVHATKINYLRGNRIK